jgi:hypothetical protein
MKIRKGFVSNSSSSSFIVIGKEPEGVSFAELTKEQAKNVIDFINNDKWYKQSVNWDGQDPVYMTAFLSDSCEWETWDEFCETHKDYYVYMDGGHGEPYSEENFDKLTDDGFSSVWIWRPHNGGEL